MSTSHLPSQRLSPEEDFTGAIIPADSERLVQARGLELDRYSDTIRVTQRAQDLLTFWEGLYQQPFKGITNDGVLEEGLFELADEGFDPQPAVDAAELLLSAMSAAERKQSQYVPDAREWRGWYNPEWLVNDYGLRLEHASDQVHEHLASLMRSCFSEAGYHKIEQARSANAYLGELYDLRHIMGEWTYHLLVFGTPSPTEPWGWSLYGHHLALNVFIVGPQIVISPTFIGTEPTIIERESGECFRLGREEELLGLELMRSLTPELQRRAVIYPHLVDPAMPEGRWWFADERHLGGAFQDNRVVPYEGVRGDALNGHQRELLLQISETFISYLPDRARAYRMDQIANELDRTWWSWIGGFGPADPFYYRIQSPVVMVEFDNHCGIWLTNTEPAKYHVHTIARTPNGGDYGRALLQQHRQSPRDDERHDH
jgi:Protein of unknown function (DUF3500)